MTNVQTAIKALEALTFQEMADLIPQFNAMMKAKRTVASVEKVQSTGGFKYGDILSWFSHKRNDYGRHFIKFEKFNRACTCVVGQECDKDGKPVSPKPGKTGQWTVAISYIDQVNGTKIGAQR